MSKTTIHIDRDDSVFYFLKASKYDIISGNSNISINSRKVDNDIYIKMNKNSWHNGVGNVIDMTPDHDLDMLKHLKNYDMNPPEYIFCNNVKDYYRLMNKKINYMIKPFYCARTIGQLLVNTENIISVINDASLIKDANKFNKKYNVDISTCKNIGEESKCKNAISETDFYLSEELHFTEEYRVLYMRGVDPSDYIICKRYGYKANSEDERKSILLDSTTDHIIRESGIIEKIADFGDNHRSPMLSFDVAFYKGNPYIFEYSVEFATEFTGERSVIEHHVNTAIDTEIKLIKNGDS